MSYKYRDSGLGGVDAIFVTKKGVNEGGFPNGFIIPIGYLYVEEYREEIKDISRKAGIQTYVAKHCDDPKELTHIVPAGTVNRFGIFFTKEKMPDGNWCLDVGKGEWFTRKNFRSVNNAFRCFCEKEEKRRRRSV